MAGRVLIAIVLGIASAAATVPLARMTMTAIHETRDVLLLRGTAAWQGNERRSAMIRWINVETVGPLVAESPAVGDVPDWAEPAPPADARRIRAAAVGVGWPLPLLAAEWRAERDDESFPPPAQYDTSGDSPKEAVRRLMDGDPKAVRTVLLPQAVIDSSVFALAWYAIITATCWLRGRPSLRRDDRHHHAHHHRQHDEQRDHP